MSKKQIQDDPGGYEAQIARLRDEIQAIEDKREAEILAWAKEHFEGRIVKYDGGKSVVKVRKVYGAHRYSWGGVELKATGIVLRHSPYTGGFELNETLRTYGSYSKKPFYHHFEVKGDVGENEFLAEKEWAAEVKRARQLNEWLVDKLGNPVIRSSDVVYIKDGELVKGTVFGFDESTGVFQIGYMDFDTPRCDWKYDYRPGREFVGLIIRN